VSVCGDPSTPRVESPTDSVPPSCERANSLVQRKSFHKHKGLLVHSPNFIKDTI
jgi:hypothetical protein